MQIKHKNMVYKQENYNRKPPSIYAKSFNNKQKQNEFAKYCLFIFVYKSLHRHIEQT